MPTFPPSGTWIVYRLKAVDESLLYVDATPHLQDRLDRLAGEVHWWNEVAGVAWEIHADERRASDARRALIHSSHPRYDRLTDGEPMRVHAVRLSLACIEAIEDLAHRQGRKVSTLHRDLLELGLAAHALCEESAMKAAEADRV